MTPPGTKSFARMKRDLTAERVRELLVYDPSTGHFKWRANVARCIKPGMPAGTIDKLGYVSISIKRRVYKAHRLAWLYMTGEWPARHIDHVDCNPANNAFVNLREATFAENRRNQGAMSTNKSGLKGVSFRSDTGKWRAVITADYRRVYLGHFSTKEAAYTAYCEAARTYHGEFCPVFLTEALTSQPLIPEHEREVVSA